MKNMCTVPWVGFSNDPDGRIRACCISKDHVTKEDGSYFYTQKDNIKDIFHSKYMNDLRQEFKDGKMPSNCSTCWKDEENGYTSKRQHYNQIIKEYLGEHAIPEIITSQPVSEYPFDFQVILTNACNLKCRSCGSSHSTEWYKELKTMTPETVGEIGNYLYPLPHGQAGDRKGEFISSMEDWLPFVKRIEIVGGEPFYTKNWENAWNFMIEKGKSQDIILNMSTNATIINEPLVRRIAENFKRVGIGLSIDGMGKTFEYLRKNAIWDEVTKNLIKFNEINLDYQAHNKTFFNYTYTTSWINAYELPEFHDWIREYTPSFNIWMNIIHSPEHMCLYMIPKISKDRIKKKWLSYDWGKFQKDIDGMISYMYSKQPSKSEIKKVYKRYTILDKYRTESTFDVVKDNFPELEEFFEDE